LSKKATPAVANADTEIPLCWMPLFEWRKRHYKKQRDFTEAIKDKWEVVFLAGNGTGKTAILYWNLICLCLGIHPYQSAFAQPPLRVKVLMLDFEHGYGKIFTDTVLRSQHLPDGSHILPMATLDPYMITSFPTKEDKTLNFYNKSMIFFQTSEQKKRQHSGTNFDILACDEEPEWSVYDESKRGLRTAKGGGRILHAFTPPFDEADKNKGPSWTKFKLIDPWEAGDSPEVQVIRAAMSENPAITADFIRKFSKGKTEEQIRIQIYGEYPTWGQLVFPDFMESMWQPKAKVGHLLPNSFEVPHGDPDCKFEMALDWHGSKPAAVIWSFEWTAGPNKGDVIVYDEISPKEGAGMTISQLAHAIREHEGWTQKPIRRWGDPKMKDKNNALISGFSPWDEFNHCGIRLQEGWNREPYVGYSIINDFLRGKGQKNMEHPRVFVRENCKSLIFCMKNHYNVAHKDGTAEPDPKFSDYPVCLKYIMQHKSRKIKKNQDKQGQHSKWPLTSFGNHTTGRSYVDYGTWIPPQRRVA
jgi:hypothetical protein